ncbi:hypothetical protein QN277_006861 [Acacia crassicarpa]|uniref:Uncharacterized protein n=1 Tax=Acacia crassicarpa TaxID=499986 RepID=A0AAE1IVT2_9FABA|nr:hypothetical protein QN277_006861 [Acacia crassicarpa]
MDPLNDNMSLFHYPAFTRLPRTDYSLAMTCEISEEDKPPNSITGNRLEAIIELRIRQKYTMILEPIKGQRVSLEDDFVVSPELTLQFKIPLAHFRVTDSNILRWQDRFISARLALLPINDGLGKFLKPHIQHHAGLLARQIGHRREFKLIFSVTAIKIDFADAEECDKIRSGWMSSTPAGSQNQDD